MNEDIINLLKLIESCNNDIYKLTLDYKCCQLLLDYITNLQEENEYLKKEKKKISQQHIYTLDKLIETQTKIDDAIEYINENDYIDLNGYDLLKILGSDE